MRQIANKVIAELIQSKDFKQCISKIKPEDLQEDLASEVTLILLETKPELIVQLSDRNELKFYAVRIIFNMACSNTSPFFKKYKQAQSTHQYDDNFDSDFYDMEGQDRGTKIMKGLYNNINTDELFDECEVKDRKKLELLAFSLIDNLYWYDAMILKLYLVYGDYRKTSEETKIPFTSIYRTVQKAAKDLKTLVDNSELPKDTEINSLITKIQKSLKVDFITA